MIALNKILGLIVLFYQHGYAFGQNCPNSTVVKRSLPVCSDQSEYGAIPPVRVIRHVIKTICFYRGHLP